MMLVRGEALNASDQGGLFMFAQQTVILAALRLNPASTLSSMCYTWGPQCIAELRRVTFWSSLFIAALSARRISLDLPKLANQIV